MRAIELVDSIRHIMVKEVITIAPESSLRTAANLMVKKRVGSIPVVKRRRLVGIITESDFMRFASTGCDMTNARVIDYMKKTVITCGPSCRIVDALMIMKRHRVRHLPITTRTRRLLGIVSLRDLIAASQLTSLYLI